MKKEISTLTAIYALTMLLMCIPSLIPYQPVRIIFSYFAYFIPIGIGFIFIKRRGRLENESPFGFGMQKDKILPFIPTVAPTISIIIAVAFLSERVLSFIGYQSTSPVIDNLFLGILVHALLPAILEEVLFRYIPIKLLLPYSGKWCVIFSTIFFSVMHLNLFTIPYAAVAGFIFVLIDIYAKGALPSIIIHFVNNTISVIMIRGYTDSLSPTVFVIIAAVLALGSLGAALVMHKMYKGFLSPLSKRCDGELTLGAPLTLAAVALIISGLYLIGF